MIAVTEDKIELEVDIPSAPWWLASVYSRFPRIPTRSMNLAVSSQFHKRYSDSSALDISLPILRKSGSKWYLKPRPRLNATGSCSHRRKALAISSLSSKTRTNTSVPYILADSTNEAGNMLKFLLAIMRGFSRK